MTLEPMARDEAERITERIRVALDRVSQSWADLGDRITEAYQRRADLALGYESWFAYAEAELKPSTGLAAEVRRQLVGMLSQAGMSTRAIAPTVGVTHKTVVKDTQVVPEVPPADPVGPADATEQIDPLTGEVLDADRKPSLIAPAPQPVTGLDGKTYPKPTPKPEVPKPRRRPLTDAFSDGVYQLRVKVESLERLTRDDRFAANKEKAAQTDLHRLTNTRDLLQQVIEQLS